MLDLLLEEIPSLVAWVVDAQVRGKASSAISKNGRADAASPSTRRRRKAASRTTKGTQRKATRARKAAVAPRPGGRITGVRTSESQLPIRNYETQPADEVLEKLAALSQADLAKIDSFERQHENRSSILSRIAALRGGEPGPGYHERAANETGAGLSKGYQEPEEPGGVYGGMRGSRESLLESTTQ